MAEMPRKLQPDDILYRALAPIDGCDENGPTAGGFEDTGGSLKQPSDTLSFQAEGVAALSAISGRASVRRACGSGKNQPTPQQMYEHGYRVAAIRAEVALQACAANPKLSIVQSEDGSQIEPNGHIQIKNGHNLADIWARNAAILSKEETFGQEPS